MSGPLEVHRKNYVIQKKQQTIDSIHGSHFQHRQMLYHSHCDFLKHLVLITPKNVDISAVVSVYTKT